MPQDIGDTEAQLALSSIEQRRRQVIAEIDMPRWYWWGVALGWVALGVFTDLGHPWLTAAATLLFGAVHSAVAQRVLSGRHRAPRVSGRADGAGPPTRTLVLGYLVGLAAVTVGLGWLADADGARHPVTMASIVVAVALVSGRPNPIAP